MVQIKTSVSFVLAAAAIAPSIAYPLASEDSIATREDNEFTGSVFSRKFQNSNLEAREVDDEIYSREPEPFMGVNHIKKWMGKGKHGHHGGHRHSHGAASAEAAPAPEEQPAAREFDDELFEREPFMGVNHIKKWMGKGKHGHHGGHRHSHAAASAEAAPAPEEQPAAREFDDELFEREPFMGVNHIKKWMGKGKHGHHGGHRHSHGAASAEAAPAPEEQPAAREFDDELFEREPFMGVNHIKKWMGKGKHGHHGGHRHSHAAASAEAAPAPEEQPAAREFDDELFEREPFMGVNHIKKWMGKGKHGHHGGHRHSHAAASAEAAPPAEEQPAAREYDELLERYFDDLYERELDAREPFMGMNHIKKWMGKGKHGHHGGHGRHSHGGASAEAAPPAEEQPAAREYDELLEREFYDLD